MTPTPAQIMTPANQPQKATGTQGSHMHACTDNEGDVVNSWTPRQKNQHEYDLSAFEASLVWMVKHGKDSIND